MQVNFQGHVAVLKRTVVCLLSVAVCFVTFSSRTLKMFSCSEKFPPGKLHIMGSGI